MSYAALLLPAALAVCLLAGVAGGDTSWLVFASVIVAATAVPLAVGIAVFRYRLFDIELVFSRTLIYGTLTLTVVAFTMVLVLGLDALLNNIGLAGGLAAAAAALLIQPLHGWLRLRVERWVYGDRSDPYAALSRLGARLSAAPAAAEVLPAIIGSVVQALSLSYAAIELERGSGREIAASAGRLGDRAATWFPLVYRGETLGRLGVVPAAGVDALRAPDRRLLEDLARQSGVAIYGVRLTTDLQRSRERLVAAREEERRRVRRDLHDGLGPSLSGMVLKLGAARAQVVAAPEAERLLVELTEEVQAAIAEIRRLVEGLRPAALDELGLLHALHAQVERLGSGFALSAPDTLPDLPAAIEVAAYRIASEALTNAARHSGAERCELRVAVNGMLEVEVEDDGRGLVDPVRSGLGLRSMRDRADEVGGTLIVAAGTQGGTLVRASLPIEEL
jgi:signal transduction histidine kinase